MWVKQTRSTGSDSDGPVVVDMRSDTVTKPTDEMLGAMANAEVGDDVFGDDPTVNELQEFAAEKLGKEAALFVPSGTMGNLLCTLVHTSGRGEEAIFGDQSHMFVYEVGGTAAVAGVQPRIVPNQPDGTLRIEDILAAIRTEDDHYPITKMVALENTHNKCGGKVLPPSYIDSVADAIKEHGIVLHCDAARLPNAAAALNVGPDVLLKRFDSASMCLSKGLGAPVGSVIVGTKQFIRRARHMRKMLGGGMRQAGLLAAAGLVAIRNMWDRLQQDAARASLLAAGIRSIPGCHPQAGLLGDIEEGLASNMVYFGVSNSAQDISASLKARGVLILPTGPNRMRAVLSHHVTRDGVMTALQALWGACGGEEIEAVDAITELKRTEWFERAA